MNKRIIYIIIFILLVIAFSVMIYFVFIADLIGPGDDTNANQNTNTQNVNGLPVTNGAVTNTNRVNVNQTNSGGFIISNTVNQVNISNTASGGSTVSNLVLEGSVNGVSSAPNGDGVRVYNLEEGKFFRIDDNGNVIPLSENVFPQVEDVVWSPANNKAIMTYPDGSQIMYDFDSQQQVTLPKEWDDIEFSSTGEDIGFINLSSNENERWLAVSNPDGSQIQLIEPVGDKANSVDVNWSPSNQVVATYREGASTSSQEVYLVGLNDENFKSIFTDGRGFEGKWSPSGDQMLYSIYNAGTRYNPTLYLVDASGDNIGTNQMSLGLQTWSDKCTFSSSSPALYCAVPQLLPAGAGLDPSVAEYSNDSIYKINTNTGDRELIALPVFLNEENDYNISSLFLNGSETELYFTNSLNDRLYKINL